MSRNKLIISMLLYAGSLSALTYVDYDVSMNNQYIEWCKTNPYDYKWEKRIKARYKRLSQESPTRQAEACIPKIIHQIWLGSEFPQKYQHWQQSWLQNHPDWEYKLWTDDDIDSLELENADLLEKAANFGQKADILRYEILHKFGGLYVDVDFECFAPFDELHHTYSFYAGLSNGVGSYEINNALIGSAAGHPVMRRCIDHLRQTLGHLVKKDALGDLINYVVGTSGPVFFSRCFMELESSLDDTSIIFPPTFFFPLPFWDGHLTPIQRLSSLRPESLAMHHWGHSWVKDLSANLDAISEA